MSSSRSTASTGDLLRSWATCLARSLGLERQGERGGRRGATWPAWPWPAMLEPCPWGFCAWARCKVVPWSRLGLVVAKIVSGLINFKNVLILFMLKSPYFA